MSKKFLISFLILIIFAGFLNGEWERIKLADGIYTGKVKVKIIDAKK